MKTNPFDKKRQKFNRSTKALSNWPFKQIRKDVSKHPIIQSKDPCSNRLGAMWSQQEELIVKVLVPSLVNPIPIDDFIDSVNESGKLLIVDEGVKLGGWGSEVSNQVYEKCFNNLSAPIEIIGAPHTPVPSSKNLEDQYFPNQKLIENKIKRLYEK